MPRLSVTVIALNEEANIVPCLESVRFADEIVVVDSGSTDRTLELARNFTDRIFTTEWRGFAGTKNFALEQATKSDDAEVRTYPWTRKTCPSSSRSFASCVPDFICPSSARAV